MSLAWSVARCSGPSQACGRDRMIETQLLKKCYLARAVAPPLTVPWAESL